MSDPVPAVTSSAPVRSSRAWPRRTGQEQARQRGEGEDADGHVDVEDPLPAGPVGQRPAQEHTDGRSGAADGGPDAERLVAFRAVEAGCDDRERGRGEQSGSDALGHPAAQQHGRARGEPGDQGRGGEHRDPGEDGAVGAEHVGEAPAEQHQPAEAQGVRGHHPGQRLPAEAEVGRHVGQGDVHDGDVQDEHELGQAEQDEHQPAARVGRGLRSGRVVRVSGAVRHDGSSERAIRKGEVRPGHDELGTSPVK